jgi:hypothetical protein
MIKKRVSKKNHLKNSFYHKWTGESLSALIFLLLFTIGTVLSAPINCAGDQSQLESIPTPLIVLHHTEGNFFVLASDIPFKVSQADPAVSWMEIKKIKGKQTLHRIVPIKSRPEGLLHGTYYSTIRVDLLTSIGLDYILIPVVLLAGEEFEYAYSIDQSLQSEVPREKVRLQIKDPNIKVRFMMTPGGHYVFEIIDWNMHQLKLQQLHESTQLKKKQVPFPTERETYGIVFPWMALFKSLEKEKADVAPNLDAVNALSYIRYTMYYGKWDIRENRGDPGPWADGAGLAKWPMVQGGLHPDPKSVRDMWDNRAEIATNMITEANENSYKGYCIDLEAYNKPKSMKKNFIDLVDYLADRLHENGFRLMVVNATWGGDFIAQTADLAPTSVDYVATMDTYTNSYEKYVPENYNAIGHHRLIWGFFWGVVDTNTQYEMWDWMETEGYNKGVAGAAGWRIPLMPPHPGNDVDYYQGFRDYYPIGLADLKVSEITFTSPPKAGVRTTAVAHLKNSGQVESGVFRVKWYLDGQQVGYGSHKSLDPGEVSNDNVRFDWTPTPGGHTLRFRADVKDQVNESNEKNNSGKVKVTVKRQKLADLEVSEISFTSPPIAGEPTTAVAHLTNIGNKGSGGFNVKWYLDGKQVGYGFHKSLDPGEVSNDNIRFDWTPTPGVHTLRFKADVDKFVKESNENNNSAKVTVTVKRQKLADLKVSKITFTSPPEAGVLTTAVAHLTNIGKKGSGTFNVKWYLDGKQVGYGFHKSLAPGEVSNDNIRFDWTPTPGVHTLRFKADVDKYVKESNEKNNSAKVTVTVQ